MVVPALLFDLDGTLVDSAMGIASALSVLAIERGGTAIDVRRVRGLISRGAAELVATGLGDQARDSMTDLAGFRDHLARIPADPAMIYPGVTAALDDLADQGHVMAIVTNKPESLARQLLDQLDLARYFPVVVGGDTLATAKPDPAPLLHALAQLGHRGPAIMIGDSGIDARASAAAAIPFILYRGGYGADECNGLPISAQFDAFAGLSEQVCRTMSCADVSAIAKAGDP